MPDRDQCIPAGTPADTPSTAPLPVDWTDDGIFRGAFLALFKAGDRAVLRQAGEIIATQAIAGDNDLVPIMGDLRAVAEDARMISRYLQQIAEARHGSETSDREHALCLLAERWRNNAADIAFEIEGEVEEAPGEPAIALGPEETAAALRLLVKLRAALEEARNLQRLDRHGLLGRSVGNLAEGLTVLEAAIKAEP